MKKKFKRIISILATTAMMFSLSACGGNTADSGNTNSDTVKIAYLPITHALPVFEEAKELEAGNRT